MPTPGIEMVAKGMITIAALILLGGCGRWAVERQEEQAAELIDAGMRP